MCLKLVAGLLTATLTAGFAISAAAQEVLPFPPKPSGSTAGRTMQESVYSPLPPVSHLPKDAPNILIVLIDDVGPAQTDTYGGKIHTPTLSKIAHEGISYNRFHTTAMCSPTRAALLTGRNPHRVGNGQIGELANDWDGYSGAIPKSSATVAEVLKDYGYSTAAWGKWHNTPPEQTTAAGPFNNWPAGYGFEYFYGFLGGEASQWEPQLVRNTAYVEHPHSSGGHNYYHLSEDLADDAIGWLREHKALAPDKPFFMYWASGASHGPFQVPKEWADKYKGKFDDGWDKYRERVYQRAKQMGWIPSDAQLTPRPATLASWDSIPDDEKPFQRRLMELFAGTSTYRSAASSMKSISSVTATTRWFFISSAITALRLRVKTAQSASFWRRMAFLLPPSSRSRRSIRSAASTRSARLKPTLCIMLAGPGRAARLIRRPS